MEANTMKNMYMLVRHGETEWNTEGKVQGQKNSSLTEYGVQQAQSLFRLRQFNPCRIYCSPLERARTTANLACFDFVMDNRLMEMSFGDYEGMTSAEIIRLHPTFFIERNSNKWDFCWPGGESHANVYERAKSFIESLGPSSGLTLIIAHETVNKMLAGILLNLPQEKILKLGQSNGLVWLVQDETI